MTPKRITLSMDHGDPAEPDVGTMLRSTRSLYLVVSSRRMNTRDGARRYALGVININEAPDGAQVFWFRWNRRKKR